jgi:hypothetical protein
MNIEKAKAGVQYNDMKGTAAADWRDFKHLEDLAQSQAIDLQKHIPIGLSIYLGEPQGSELDMAAVSLFAVDPMRVGGDGDSIKAYLELHQGVVPCKRFRFEMPLVELLKFFKRFNLTLQSRYAGEILEYQFD